MTDATGSYVVLDDVERRFLRAALLDWGGPARPTDAFAVAMGFSSASQVSDEAWQLWQRIEAGEMLTADDWRRVLLAAEVAFASDVVGSGLDWSVTSGIPDVEAIAVLRGLQGKLSRWRDSVQFAVDDSGNAIVSDSDRPRP